MKNDSTETTVTSSARRRLVRGAFAAPAILTLCSGSALAATSVQLCIANKVNQSPVFPAIPVDNTWLRVQRYKTVNGQTTTYYIKGSEVAGLLAGKTNLTTYLLSGEYQNISQAGLNKCALPSGLQTDTNNFVAVRVDASGNIKGWAGDGITSGSSAMSGSCWASFKGL